MTIPIRSSPKSYVIGAPAVEGVNVRLVPGGGTTVVILPIR